VRPIGEEDLEEKCSISIYKLLWGQTQPCVLETEGQKLDAKSLL
jgi:hypothetical protein